MGQTEGDDVNGNVSCWHTQRLRPEIAAVSATMRLLTLLALGAVAFVLRRAWDSAGQIARTMAGG